MKVIARAAASLLLLPGLAACGQAAEDAAERAIEQGTGGDVEINDNGVSVTDDEGNEFAVGGDVELPDSWPSEVPTPSGATLASAIASPADGTATTVWTTSGSSSDALSEYDASLIGAGFTLAEQVDLGIGETRAYTGNGLDVTVISGEANGSASITVSVAPQG